MRNEPCPCGSGLKYKKCCLAKDEAASRPAPENRRARELIDLDQALSRRLLTVFRESPKHFQDFVTAANLPEPTDSLSQSVLDFAVNWMLFHYPSPAESPAGRYRPKQGDESLWLTRSLEAPLTLWQILELQPGKGVLLHDVLLKRDAFVWDVGLSNSGLLHAGLLGCIVNFEGLHVTQVIHPQMLPPLHLESAIKTLKARKLTSSFLAGGEAGALLLRVYEDELEKYYTPVMPEIRNTDGDVLKMVEEAFTFPAARARAIREALLKMTGAQEDGTGTINFSEQRLDAALESVSVGTADMTADRLVLHTNSVKRANRLRKRVELACSGLHLEREKRRVRDLDFEQPLDDAPDQALMEHPEVKSMLAKVRKRVNDQWLNLRNPQLGNKSPRQLAETPAGRATLEKTLGQFIFRGDDPEEIAYLRSQLGMI